MAGFGRKQVGWEALRRLPGVTRGGVLVTLLGVWLSPAAGLAQSTPGSNLERTLAELHQLINEHRAEVGCPPLLWHEPTARVAEAHSIDMARRDYFDHVTPEGTDLSRRLLAGDVAWRGSIAENLALTVRGPDVVLELWLGSPPHRANIEECAFTHHGIGLFEDRWTEVLVEDPVD